MGLQLHRSFPFIDFVCGGEADLSFPQLLDRMRNGQDVHGVPGVISRKDGSSYFSTLHPERVRDLDSLPYPEYDDYFSYLEREGCTLAGESSGYVLMETSRGCWWGEKAHCTFCGLNGVSMQYRSKSWQRALDEIVALTTRHHTLKVEMVDNILDMQYFRDLLPELKRRELNLDIFYETKANLREGASGFVARGRGQDHPARNRELQHPRAATHPQGHHCFTKRRVAEVVQAIRREVQLEPDVRASRRGT